MQVTILATPGVTLGWHAEQCEVRSNILHGGYDFVVLQPVAHPFGGRESLLKEVQSLAELVRNAGSIPVLFMTWASLQESQKQHEIEEAFLSVARETGVRLAPVGAAWHRVLMDCNHLGSFKINTEKIFEKGQADTPLTLNLFDSDGEHASPAGSYLTACVFYSLFMKESPVELPERILSGGNILVNLDKSVATVLQQQAWKTVQETFVNDCAE